MNKTYHCAVERASRVDLIEKEIGMGSVIKEIYVHGAYNQLTDTGIVMIVNDSRDKLITMYVATRKDLNRFYPSCRYPSFLMKKVDHNQSLFTVNGKTLA